MNKSNYRDLVVWQKSRQLAVAVYRATGEFPRAEIVCMTQQLRRAALSVVSNIAEAHGRRSARDVLQFLGIARGSLLEIEAQLIIAGDLEYLSSAAVEQLLDKSVDVTRLLNGLMRHYEQKT
ncbi:MAG TPA: four helix bundle protein [Thermoanaerobaculia bacterium]|nr:four helix bundle protein [Thermoanaerobaculia bacterium]